MKPENSILLPMLRLWSRLAEYALPLVLSLLALSGAASVYAADWAHDYGIAAANTYANATAVDAAGNVYVTGILTVPRSRWGA